MIVSSIGKLMYWAPIEDIPLSNVLLVWGEFASKYRSFLTKKRFIAMFLRPSEHFVRILLVPPVVHGRGARTPPPPTVPTPMPVGEGIKFIVHPRSTVREPNPKFTM